MSKKHLTFDDRLAIQAGLQQGLKIAQIAKRIGKDRSTVGREIKAHRRLVASSKGNNCVHHAVCAKVPQCRPGCIKGKRQCQSACGGCIENCPDYLEEFCAGYETSPFVCNSCEKRMRCRLRRMLYDAKYAQEQYENLLSESRKGISLSEAELDQINGIVSPLLKQGQSLPAICETHRGELPVSGRTIYSYMELHPDAAVCQMDSVIIHPGGQAILTVFFTTCDLQLMFLRERNTSASVTEVFQKLRQALGAEGYCRLFEVLLTDRGSEFTDPSRIETDGETAGGECRVFYCDPMNSNQKSNCERNHEFIRYIIPKKTAKERYTEEEVRLMMNHINSYPRKKWNGQAPIDLFIKIYGQETAAVLGLKKILSDSINLTPALLK